METFLAVRASRARFMNLLDRQLSSDSLNYSNLARETYGTSRTQPRLGRWVLLAAILATFAFPQYSTAQIYVTTTLQDNTDSTKCSLREAIYATEFGGNVAIGSTDPDTTYNTGCTDASGAWDTILLQSGTTYSFNRFWDGDAHNAFGPTATPIIFKSITIVGNGATLQWTGGGNSRLFAVGFASITPTVGVVAGTTYSGTGNLTLQHVYIKGFNVKGGDGADGGGGGLGAGGAIYIGKIPSAADSPGLTVSNSTFDSNGATGGNGGVNGIGGGGGGFGGGGGHSSSPSYAGGGGGGARGNGGNGSAFDCTTGFACDLDGGGGGGTVFSGGNGGGLGIPGPGGFDCGGTGGDEQSDGHDASCPGGGGGGGGFSSTSLAGGRNGGSGKYGGGGGGASGTLSGGNGDFGGGGGSAGGGTPEAGFDCGHGGHGGFGGGGGGAGNPMCLSGGGSGGGGGFGGKGNGFYGGGGGALGGAIFNDSGTVVVENSTFYNNFVGHGFGGGDGADSGADAGGAIFSRNGSMTIQDVTISGNQGTGSGAGVEVMNDGETTTFVLENTIIAGNNGTNECIVSGSVGTDGSAGNLIVNNGGCPSVVVMSDPLLDSSPKLNTTGDTPTIALLSGSPAIGAGDSSLNTILPTDQRGVPRKGTPDIGAYEAIPIADLSLTTSVSPSTAKAGDTVTYTLTLKNFGPDTANDIAFADFLPTALTLVSCTASGGAACSSQGGFLVVSYGTLAANNSQTITIKGTVNAGASRGTVMNQASVSDASPFDPDTSNNSSSASFTVLVPDFSISAVSPVTIAVGGPGTSSTTEKSIDTFASAVKLTASGPSGFQESFNANPVTPPNGGSTTSTLTVSLGPSVTAGSYTVHVTGTSGALTHTTSVNVNVKATIAGITNVIGSFRTLGAIDNSGISNSLTSKLAEAQTYISSGDNQTATNILSAMNNEINAQNGKHITSSAAAVLVTDTQALQESLGANLWPDPVMGYVVNSSNVPLAGATVSVLDSSSTVAATATTDGTGLYFFPLTRGWTLGQNYTVKVTLPKGYKTTIPTSENFTWQASQVTLSGFVIY